MEDKRKAAYRRVFMVFLGLAVLTILEFFVSLATDGSATFMFIIALLKAGVIAHFFMHIYRLWRPEEEH